MLKFKKNGIFSRSASEEATASELQEGGVVAVWGSPGSGKTTMAVKIAKYLADKKRNVVLLLCDMTAPMLPCICPASELECERSLGSVLAAAHVTENLVKNNLITHKRLGYLTILGMLKGENEYTYPPYGEAQARELIDCLREIAPYFQMLSHDMKQLELQRLKAQAMKIPPKIRVFSFLMLMCFLMTYLAIIVYEIITSLGGMF